MTAPRAQPPSPDSTAPLLPPELVNHPRYQVLRELGRGGMGVVYHARQTMMDREVAIKVISKALLDNPDALERFRREVRAAAKLVHPNIVIAYDAEQAGDLHMLVMEYVEGRSLHDVLRKKGPLPIHFACNYVRQAALGLHHAYEKGMVHRDIKPHNLMLTTRGQVKILDFGLAKMASENRAGQGLTATNCYMGTPEYSAPEQANDARSADIRADLYSLGCTLYCLLSGTPPFQGGSAIQTIMAHMQTPPQPLPDVPPALWQVLARLLAKTPAERYQKPAELVQALAPFCKPGTKVVASREAPPVVPLSEQVTEAPSNTTPVPVAPRVEDRTAPAKTAPRPRRPATAAPSRGKGWWVLGVVLAVGMTTLFAAACVAAVLLLLPKLARDVASGTAKSVAAPGDEPGRPAGVVDRTFFNGKDLTGWEGLPGHWRVTDGALVGALPPRARPAHTFLCSKKKYRNFELKCRVRLLDGIGDSGIQFRSELGKGPGFSVVRGPQFDIGGEHWGSLYGEGDGGWRIYPPPGAVEKVLKKSDYNDVVIRCVGRHVTAWLNGTQVLDNTVPLMADEGIIAFEYSSLAPREVTFRNLELTDLGTEDPAAGFRPLFNGKDLSGWWVYGGGAGNWKVVNNELVGSGPQSHLFTVRGSYEDFQLHAEALINAGGNSGLHFRCNFEPGVPAGYEAQINSIAGDPNRTGTLLVYKGPGRSRVVSHNTSRVPPGEWFSYDVLAQGNHLVLRVNGQVTVDYVDPENTFRKGHIALQQFDPNTVVRFRKIEIKELPPPAAGR